jgi:predicted Zn-dependent protease
MESDEFRTVRVYTKKYTSKDKDGNSVEKESKQKQVSLKKEDPFEDNELVRVLSQKDYEKLIDNQFSDEKLDEFHHIIEAKDAEIKELQSQIQTLKGSFFDDVDSLKGQFTDKEELVKAKDEIYELNKEIKKINEKGLPFLRNLIIKIR